MTTVIQLNPTIPLDTPKGKATAFFLIDYSQEHHLSWVTFIDATGECWTFENRLVRLQSNYSIRPST